MEKLFHYVWKHKLFPPRQLGTTSNENVEVVDVGLLNNDAGPDFFNAKIKIGAQLWVGNVELHIKASQWYQHGHDKDAAYDNVILHVVCNADCETHTSKGTIVPTLTIDIPEKLKNNYEHLLKEDKYPRCFRIIPELPKLTLHSWLSALHTERLERKTHDILRRLDECNGSWEDAYFLTLARYFGFGINTNAFETWSKSVPMRAVDHHRDDIFQIEAIFLGQAGLLDINSAPKHHHESMTADEYYQKISSEYKYLAHKFSLVPMDYKQWKFLRLRPQNFPTVRLSQLAALYYNRKAGLSQILECNTVKELEKALSTHATEYWQSHYLFGEESRKSEKKLSNASVESLIINTVIPMLFAYGKYKSSKEIMNRAIDLMEQIQAENNNIVRMWRECGLEVGNAADSQALIQLKKEYCDKKDCLRCRIGYQYLKTHK